MTTLPKNPSLRQLQEYMGVTLKERGFGDETAVEKCLLLGEEVGELFKAVRKTTHLKCDSNSDFGAVEHELADIFMYTLDIANKYGIDLEEAFHSKEEINRKRTWK
jgi:NTP pyrophosphatase (non-canonical NTP hydrolase)